jgi:hypothetical protein
MELTTYGYSKFVGWSGAILFSGLLLFFVYMGFSAHSIVAWSCLSIPILLVSAISIAFFRGCFIPMLNGAVTLELDEEKLQCYLNGVTIYWKDVVEISERPLYYQISFEMVNDTDDLSITTQWMSGSNKVIYNKMQEYFARTI